VSDFTYVGTWASFVYVAFVLDAFAPGSSTGVSRVWLVPALWSMHWSRRCTIAVQTGRSCITLIAAANTSRSNTANA